MTSTINKPDYAIRDQQGKVSSYVLLWKRKGIGLDTFENYWKDVHGPIAARLPGLYQYWQFHLGSSQEDLWLSKGVEFSTLPEEPFNGIAELTFTSEVDRQTFFNTSTILKEDGRNLFSKVIVYHTQPGHSKTYIDRIVTGDPNGKLNIVKFHVLVQKANHVSVNAFQQYMKDSFAASIAQSKRILKFRLHLFEEIENSSLDVDELDNQYHAAFEIAFHNFLELEKFVNSKEYITATKNQAKYIKQISPLLEQNVYTLVYDGKMTLAGQRSPKVAGLITKLGAVNQLREDVVSLMSPSVSYCKSQQIDQSDCSDTSKTTNFSSINIRGAAMQERLPGEGTELVTRLFARGEAFDSEGFLEFFTDTPVYQFGNFAPCFTKAAIKKSIDAFFSQVSALYHDIKMMWEIGDVVFVEMDVIYWRLDGSVVTLPCCDIFRLDGHKFSELRIFMDANPVGDASISVPDISSVLTIKQNKRLNPPDVMKKYFYEHPEGQERLESGYAPKWMSKAVRQILDITEQADDEDSEVEQINIIKKLSDAIINENWAKVKSFLTDSIYYRVGSSEAISGKQAVVDYFSSLFRNTAKLQYENILRIWEEPGFLTVEIEAEYVINNNNSSINIACSNVFHFKGNKIDEWRSYADLSPLYVQFEKPLSIKMNSIRVH